MAVISPSDETNEEDGHFGLQIEHHKMMQPNYHIVIIIKNSYK